jgi:hypothetical protein
MFDFLPVGAALATVGVLFLSIGWRLIPHGRKGQASPDAAIRIADYVAELQLPAGSP